MNREKVTLFINFSNLKEAMTVNTQCSIKSNLLINGGIISDLL